MATANPGSPAKPASVVGLDACATPSVDADRVAAARERLLDTREAARLAELFRLLGDPGRARILFALLEAGELCVCDLAATVSAPETSVSHALRLLRTAGIVRNRRDGRNVFYSLDDAHVRMLLDLSREHLRHGDGPEVTGARP
jgi:DNA-binding transcriptional ArsR family regulator